MEEEDWDEFVNDNFLAPNDVLLFTHVDTMFIEVRIYKQDSHHLKEITSAPLQAQVVTPIPQNSPLESPSSAPASGRTIFIVERIIFMFLRVKNYSFLSLILLVQQVERDRSMILSEILSSTSQIRVTLSL